MIIERDTRPELFQQIRALLALTRNKKLIINKKALHTQSRTAAATLTTDHYLTSGTYQITKPNTGVFYGDKIRDVVPYDTHLIKKQISLVHFNVVSISQVQKFLYKITGVYPKAIDLKPLIMFATGQSVTCTWGGKARDLAILLTVGRMQITLIPLSVTRNKLVTNIPEKIFERLKNRARITEVSVNRLILNILREIK